MAYTRLALLVALLGAPPAADAAALQTPVLSRCPDFLRLAARCARHASWSLLAPSRRDSVEGAPSPGRAFLFSAVLPGSGQVLLGQERWPPYVALELWSWIQFVDSRREGLELQRRYRDLAWLVARRVSTGPRREGDFEYYEALSEFRASGAFDADPARSGVQPEQDESTYNGSIWALAQALFFPADEPEPAEDSPAYGRALEYYRERAFSPSFAWDWGENGLEQEAYARLIRDSDEVLRRATIMIGVLLGNHLVSAVDALISARIQARMPLPHVRVEARYDPGPPAARWLLLLRISP